MPTDVRGPRGADEPASTPPSTAEPTAEPTDEPTAEPPTTAEPTVQPAAEPTPQPTNRPPGRRSYDDNTSPGYPSVTRLASEPPRSAPVWWTGKRIASWLLSRPGRRLLVLLVIIALLSPVASSYATALRAPGNTPLTVRSVEWVRENHGRWIVNDIENFWYSHHKPKKGGAPKNALTVPGARATTSTTAAPKPSGPTGPRRTGHDPSVNQPPTHLPPPAPLVPIVAGPLPGEGQWAPIGQTVENMPAIYATELRPDTVYTSVVAGVAWMDPMLVKATLYAGVQEPGGHWQYQAPVAIPDRPNLLAAFNSGFLMKDAQGGYYSEGHLTHPLRDGAATFVIKSDGTPTVGMWGRDFQMGPDIASARQNLSLIIDNGVPAPDLATGGSAKWGATLGNKLLVWRSGVGVTANGALVYAGGNNLSATTLAGVLVRAGAVRAMELDINSEWVDYFTYGPPAPTQAPTSLSATKLLPDMRASLDRYLTANSRDFIAIFRRQP